MGACHSVCSAVVWHVQFVKSPGDQVLALLSVQFSIFWTTGQICTATSRLLVAAPIATQFFDRLKASCHKKCLLCCQSVPRASFSHRLPFTIHTVWCTLQTRAAQIEIGDPFSETSRMGPLINKQQYDKVLGYIEVLLSAALFLGAERHTACAPDTTCCEFELHYLIPCAQM
jgi:Aldehyde dehydrogenase family